VHLTAGTYNDSAHMIRHMCANVTHPIALIGIAVLAQCARRQRVLGSLEQWSSLHLELWDSHRYTNFVPQVQALPCWS